MAGEVTTLEHELGDDTVEGRALVALTLGTRAELTEVASSLGDVLLVEVEVDAANLGWRVGGKRSCQSDIPLPLEDSIQRKRGEMKHVLASSHPVTESQRGVRKGCSSVSPSLSSGNSSSSRSWRGKIRKKRRESKSRLTGAGAHRGVLDFEEGLGVSRHGCGCLMERTKREERRGVANGDGEEGTRSEGRARWGYC